MGFEIDGFGARLLAALAEQHMSQGELSRRAGLRPETISRWSRGQTPRVPELVAVAEVLDVSIDWLLYGDPEQDATTADALDWAIEQAGLDTRGSFILREACARIGKLERDDVYFMARRIAANAAERAAKSAAK